MEALRKEGKIKKFISDNCIELVEGGLYSQFGGIDEGIKEYDIVKFVYKTKEKDGRTYNNIVSGSMELVSSAPKDISQDYSQASFEQPSISRPDDIVYGKIMSLFIQAHIQKNGIVDISEDELKTLDKLVKIAMGY